MPITIDEIGIQCRDNGRRGLAGGAARRSEQDRSNFALSREAGNEISAHGCARRDALDHLAGHRHALDRRDGI